MAAAVDFFATQVNEIALLDYLGEPRTVSLHPWPISPLVPAALDRRDLAARPSVMVVSDALGPPRLIRAQADASMDGGSASATFNRINWDAFNQQRTRASSTRTALQSSCGSAVFTSETSCTRAKSDRQADSMHGVSREYERWVNRVMSWVRRRGTRVRGSTVLPSSTRTTTHVWGLEGAKLRPNLDINIDHISSTYALPGALAELEAGGQGRRSLPGS